MEAYLPTTLMDEKLHSDGYSDPFVDTEWDCDEQTGADWYMLALTASLGGKAVHGLNCAPTCETLSKVPYAVADKRTHGLIRVSEKKKQVECAGDEWDMQPYTNPDFKGTQTSAGTVLAFDQGAWEPSMRTRARESSFLAAGIAAHTSNVQSATDIVSMIAAEEVDEEAVHCAIIPVSHLKREVVAVNKGSNKLFSRGTTQRMITWEDQNLTQETLPPQAAVDWGRVTTLARYIAEANVRYDPKFKMLATLKGVPFQLIRGAWAYVATSDFDLDPASFKDIPACEMTKYGIPSMKDAYVGHQMDVLAAAANALSRASYDHSPLSVEALLRMVSSVRGRVKGKTRVVMRGTEELASIDTHSMDAEKAALAVTEGATAHNELVKAISRKLFSSKPLLKSAQIIATSSRDGSVNLAKVHEVTPHIFSQPVWDDAFGELSRTFNSTSVARTRLAKLKRSLTKSSFALDVPIVFTGNILRRMEEPCITYSKKAVIRPAPKMNPLALGLSDRNLTGMMMLHAAADFARKHLTESKEAWASRYDSWAKAYNAVGTEEAHDKAVMYGTAAAAFRALSQETVLMVESRFVDGSAPKKSYLYKAAKAYSRKRRLRLPAKFDRMFATAKDIALALDKQYEPIVSFEEVEQFCFERLSEFAEDLVGKRVPEVPDEPEDLQEGAEEVAEEFEDDDLDALMFGGMDEQPLEIKVLGSYDDLDQAEKVAKANGYSTFADAVADLREGARYDTETEYTRRGLAALAQVAAEEVSDSILA